jgi:acyl carrier protein
MIKKEIESELLSVFKEFTKKTINLDFETKIDNLSLDSLDVLDLLMQIENKLDVVLPIDRFSLCYSIGDVARLINSISNETSS